MNTWGYHEYMGDVQYNWGHHEYIGGCPVHWGDIMNNRGLFDTSGGIS